MTNAYCLFLSVLAERNKRSITSSDLVSARQNFVAWNCFVGAARRAFMILIHSFEFLPQLIEQEIFSIPGNVGMYEQTKGLLLHLPKTFFQKNEITLA